MTEVVGACDVAFLCVPTPMGEGGAADVGDYDEALAAFVAAGGEGADAPVLCIRSAVPPDTIERTLTQYPALRLVVAPEFLRQRWAVEDTLAMRTLILGGRTEDCAVVEAVFRDHSLVEGPMRTGPLLDPVGAAFLKYQANCFLAAKVSFMNEFRDLFDASASRVSWSDLQEAFHLDHERFGSTHWRVPGPDGRRGWGGHCFPKDLAATRRFGADAGVTTPVLDAIWARNLEDRER